MVTDGFLFPVYPEGFKYQADLLSADEERDLVHHIQGLPLKEFEFHSYTGKRRVMSFGWHYDFTSEHLKQRGPLPDFLHPVRRQAAAFAGLDENS